MKLLKRDAERKQPFRIAVQIENTGLEHRFLKVVQRTKRTVSSLMLEALEESLTNWEKQK